MAQMALFYLHYFEKDRIRLGHAYFMTHKRTATWNSVEIPIPNPIFPSVSGPQVEAYRNIELPSIDDKFQPEKNGISNSYLYLYYLGVHSNYIIGYNL